MTGNQIAYWSLQENKRSNLVKEGETERSNRAREVETNRANVAKETETNRANLVKEAETHRHNKYTEGVDTAKAVTGGIKDIASAAGSIGKLFGLGGGK